MCVGIPSTPGLPVPEPVLCVTDERPRAWSDTEVGALKTLAERASARLGARAAVGQ